MRVRCMMFKGCSSCIVGKVVGDKCLSSSGGSIVVVVMMIGTSSRSIRIGVWHHVDVSSK